MNSNILGNLILIYKFFVFASLVCTVGPTQGVFFTLLAGGRDPGGCWSRQPLAQMYPLLVTDRTRTLFV